MSDSDDESREHAGERKNQKQKIKMALRKGEVIAKSKELLVCAKITGLYMYHLHGTEGAMNSKL
jgi:hypothetical protein